MTPSQYGALADGIIPIVFGLFVTLQGHRIIGKQKGVDPAYDAKIDKFENLFIWGGPLLVIFGIYRIVVQW